MKLEELKAGARVRGLSPTGVAILKSVEWFGEQCVQVVYLDEGGNPRNAILYGQLRYGRAVPRYTATEESVSVVLPGGVANLDLVRWVVSEGRAGRVWTLPELLILRASGEQRSITSEDAAQVEPTFREGRVQVPGTQANRRAPRRPVRLGGPPGRTARKEMSARITSARIYARAYIRA